MKIELKYRKLQSKVKQTSNFEKNILTQYIAAKLYIR